MKEISQNPNKEENTNEHCKEFFEMTSKFSSVTSKGKTPVIEEHLALLSRPEVDHYKFSTIEDLKKKQEDEVNLLCKVYEKQISVLESGNVASKGLSHIKVVSKIEENYHEMRIKMLKKIQKEQLESLSKIHERQLEYYKRKINLKKNIGL